MTDTAPAAEPAPRREATSDDDITGLRLYYRVAGETSERHIDWLPDRGVTIAEAVAVKATTVGKVTVRRMLTVLKTLDDAYEDPEAVQGLVWMVRRFRLGEDGLSITALAKLDLMSLRQEFIDAAGVELDFPVEPEPEPTAEQAQLAADLAADIGQRLPALSNAVAYGAAVALVLAAVEQQDGQGEAAAGAEPASDAPPPTTRKTSKRSSGAGSRSSRRSTGSRSKISTATPPSPA